MNPTPFFAFLGGLLALAFVANRLYRLTRIPDVILLMIVGLALGPILGWIKAAEFEPITHILGTLALILILFEGGLELNLRDTLQRFPGGVLLSVLSFGFSMGFVTLVAWRSRLFSLSSGLLVGAVVGCVSSTVVLPVLQQIRVSPPVRLTLVIDASLSDILGVLTVGILLDFGSGHGLSVAGFLAGAFSKLVLSIAIAVLTGILWARLLPVLSEQRFWQALTFSVLVLLYACAQSLSHGGLVAVLAFGLTLANARYVRPLLFEIMPPLPSGRPERHLEILSFHSELGFLVRSFFFILLGVIVRLERLRGYALLAIGVIGALVVARWAAVKASSWSWGEANRKAKEIALWIFPRGLITAVLAIQVIEARGSEFDFLPALAFAIILVTNLLVVVASVRAGPGDMSPAPEVAPQRSVNIA
ncbi:MAG TPA: cation:proton antiporter [Terriglobia bacterium]|nr:cation:proton antiporter [Terriglobia bacterium]